MDQDEQKLAREIAELKSEVQRLRDELRVRLHLGGMELRDAYGAIEREAERLGSSACHVSRATWQDVLARLKLLVAAFTEKSPPSQHPV